MKHRSRACSFLTLLAVTALCLTSLHAEAPKGGDKQADKRADRSHLPHVYRKAHILVNRGEHTVVPMRSIIYLPSKDKDKVVNEPSGKFRFWPRFLPKNQSWIMTYEITLDQAKGLKPIPEEKLKEFAKINRTVIATYRRNPISVRPYVAATPDAADSKDNKQQ